MSRLKNFLQDFPGTSAGHAVAVLLILLFGLVATVLLALGRVFPDGYDPYLVFLATLAGVSTAGMVGKRLSDVNYKAAGPTPITVEGPSNVNVAAPAAVGVAAPAAPAQPDTDEEGAQ